MDAMDRILARTFAPRSRAAAGSSPRAGPRGAPRARRGAPVAADPAPERRLRDAAQRAGRIGPARHALRLARHRLAGAAVARARLASRRPLARGRSAGAGPAGADRGGAMGVEAFDRPRPSS